MPLDPLLQPILDAINSQPPLPEGLSPAELRSFLHSMMDATFFAVAEPAPEVASQVDRRVAVDGGEITVRVYTPAGTGPFPGHLYLHGGGFWLGTLDQFDGICRDLAVHAGCIVASVDYRLAPEHRVPTAAEDSYAALLWFVEHADELGVDATRVSVGGASAGGNLAAVTALMARDRHGPRLVFQVLEIPVTDLTMSFPSITENGMGYMLTTEGVEQYTHYYLGDDGDPKHPYASPVHADDVSGLPPALVVTAEFDPLRDEGEAYGRRLQDAGVPTTVVRMDGHIHGSMGYTQLLPSAREHRARVLTALREAYARVNASVTELVDTARRDVESGWLPACQLAVARDGELVAFETFGDATNATRFHIFSATKPIVASAIWLLIGDGVLDVRRPVAEYIPEFANNGKHTVTVEQVMLHTSGFPNANMPPAEGADPARRVARLAGWRLEWEPGSRFEYHATSAHWVLAELLHRLGGCDFRDFIQERVTTPLGLPRLLGIPEGAQHDIAPLTPAGAQPPAASETAFDLNQPATRAAGVPGGGGIMRAADLALFYQALLHNPGSLWKPDVLADATTNVRCNFTEPIMNVPVNRTLGLVVGGDDGRHIMRYASLGARNSPRAFGHAGMHMQLGWADPESGISFAYATNGVDADVMREAVRGITLSDLAAAITR